MNYRTDIIEMTKLCTAETYGLPVDNYFMAWATEQVVEYWFDGKFDFDCGMDAQEQIDYSLVQMVMERYFKLEHESALAANGFQAY